MCYIMTTVDRGSTSTIMQFSESFTKSYVGAHPGWRSLLRRIQDPPLIKSVFKSCRTANIAVITCACLTVPFYAHNVLFQTIINYGSKQPKAIFKLSPRLLRLHVSNQYDMAMYSTNSTTGQWLSTHRVISIFRVDFCPLGRDTCIHIYIFVR